MKKLLFATALALSLGLGAPDEKKAIEGAARDYLDAFYEVKPELLKRSVHPELVKYGYGRWEGAEYQGFGMTFDQLSALASTFNKEGRVGADAPRKIEILDHQDKTAAAKLTAYWGVDYFHLAKLENRWQIVQVLWQTVDTPPGVEEKVDRDADKKAVERAVLDYVESAYEVKPENVDRSVDRGLVKLGFTKKKPDDEWKRHDMNFDGLRDLVSDWNKDGAMPKDAQKDVVILDLLDKDRSSEGDRPLGHRLLPPRQGRQGDLEDHSGPLAEPSAGHREEAVEPTEFRKSRSRDPSVSLCRCFRS